MKFNFVSLTVLVVLLTFYSINAATLHQQQTRGIVCTWCQTFVKDFEIELNKNEGTVEDAAKRACDKSCKNHPTMDIICKKLIEFSLDPLLKAIENHETPKEACSQIDLC